MKDKVAVITGGNGTLGTAFVRALAGAGARVFILGRNAAKSARAVEEFTKVGLNVQAVTCEVPDEGAVAGAVAETLGIAGRVDILIRRPAVLII